MSIDQVDEAAHYKRDVLSSDATRTCASSVQRSRAKANAKWHTRWHTDRLEKQKSQVKSITWLLYLAEAVRFELTEGSLLRQFSRLLV